MIVRLHDDSPGLGLEQRSRAPHDPGVKAEAERQRLGREIANGEPHGEDAHVEGVARARFVPEWAWAVGAERQVDAVRRRAPDDPEARKAIAVDRERLAGQVRSERVEAAVEMEPAAGNAVRPWDEQVQGEIERARAQWVVTGAEQRRRALTGPKGHRWRDPRQAPEQ